jgi:hypothetical protein
MRPLSFFEARAYTLAYLLVISARDDIDNTLPMPGERHRFAGILI